MIIAIDGGACTGKSTIARLLAERMNYSSKTNIYEKKHFLMDGRNDAHVKQLFYQR